MPGTIYELKGSGDFSAGPSGVHGQGLAIVQGAADQDEAYDLADGFFPDDIGGIPRGSIDVKQQGGGVFLVTVDYQSGTPTGLTGTAGQPPAGSRPAPPGSNNNDALSRDVSFSMGGATERIYVSRSTTGYAKPGDTAPDFQGLIGVNLKTKEVTGVEIMSGTADFTVTKRFPTLTLGWFRKCLDMVATTNDHPFLGCDSHECLFKGADGQYKDSDPNPWTVTARFGYSRNRTLADDPTKLTIGDIQVATLAGWEYLEVMFKTVDEVYTINGVDTNFMVERPWFVFVHTVYGEDDFDQLGFN